MHTVVIGIANYCNSVIYYHLTLVSIFRYHQVLILITFLKNPHQKSSQQKRIKPYLKIFSSKPFYLESCGWGEKLCMYLTVNLRVEVSHITPFYCVQNCQVILREYHWLTVSLRAWVKVACAGVQNARKYKARAHVDGEREKGAS